MYIWLAVAGAYAQTPEFVYLSGHLQDDNGEDAPFVDLVFRDDQFSELVVTTLQGDFSIRLRPNSRYSITVEDPRYRKYSTHLYTGNRDFDLNLVVSWRHNSSLDTYKNADTLKNPANKVIKEVIRKRNYLLINPGAYTVNAHLLSTMEVTGVKSHYPRWWLWSAVPDSSMKGINNLKEVYSLLTVRSQPRAYREEVISMRTAGRELDLDFAAHELHEINFYQSSVRLLHYSDLPYISPVSWGAFVFYKYKLLETYYREGERVYRIQVLPKNRYNRTFRGELHVAGESLSLVHADLTAPKSSGLYKVDSVRIEQHFTRISPDLWMPSSAVVTAWNRLYGASMFYRSEMEFSGYDFKPHPGRKSFGQQRVAADTSAITYDTARWSRLPGLHPDIRQEKYFHNYDSISQLQRNDKRYIDSVSRVQRGKFHWYYPFFGHTHVNELKRYSFYYDGLINDKMEFNTVEGFCYKYTVFFHKQFRNGWSMDLEPTVRFGFSDMRPKGKLFLAFSHPRHAQRFVMEGGSYYFQINQSEPINSIINSFYTLVLRRNFMKLYRKEFLRFSHERELLNGLYFYVGTEFASRTTVENNTDFSFFKWPGVQYTPNNPNAAVDSNYRLSENKAYKIKVGFTYKPRQAYMRFGRRKVVLGSSFPAVSLFYTKGIPWVMGSSVNYDLLELTITHDINFRLIGRSSYILKGGIYLNRNQMTFLDYTHFIGERGFFLGSAVNGTYLDQFRALDYFTYSTNRPFIEIHYQHDFKGFLLNQVPGLKVLKWNPLVGMNYLQLFDPAKRSYLEVFVGVDNLLGALKWGELFNLRVDVAMQIKDGVDVSPQFLFGIGTRFGETP